LSGIVEKQADLKIFDICCRSGNLRQAIAISISNLIIYSSDLSEEAVD